MTPGVPPSPQELADRAAIVDVLHAYARGVDDRDWDAVRALFTPDADLDYSGATGPKGDPETVLGWVRSMLEMAILASQHLFSNIVVTVDGDTATAAIELFNPMLVPSEPQPLLFLLGGRYDDRLVRTPDGWRIAARVHRTTWSAGPLPGTQSVPGGT